MYARNHCHWIFLAVVILFQVQVAGAMSKHMDETGMAGASSLSWLKSQVVPNATVSSPHQLRQGMILSFQVTKKSPAYRYLHNKSFLYDNAIASMAFVMSGEPQIAATMLRAVLDNVNRDKKLYFSYAVDSAWPNIKDEYGSVERTGASAWFAYALTFYCEVQGASDPYYTEFLEGAQNITRFLETFRHPGPGPMKGLYRGGINWYTFKKGEDGSTCEVYHQGPITWASSEHNLDMYFVLNALGRLTGNNKWKARARELGSTMVKRLWNSSLNQFNQGIRPEGPDQSKALDCASWGSALVYSLERYDLYSKALGDVEKYRVVDGTYRGYRPYLGSATSENPGQGEDHNWSRINLVWPEGSLGVVAALLKDNNPVYRKRALAIIRDISAMQHKNGGIPYASRNVDQHFSTWPSVASSAWMVIATTMYNQEKYRRLFWR